FPLASPIGSGQFVIDSGLSADTASLILIKREERSLLEGEISPDGGRSAVRWQAITLTRAEDSALHVDRSWQITPSERTPRPLCPAPSSASQQSWRAHTHALVQAHHNAPASTRTYMEEYYYGVPLMLALELQRRGYYQEALDWYRTVYDYTEPDLT